jgi:tetratricopeptide (TPR) repeat protein
LIGTTISHYRVVGKLGEGGMGVVYLAEDIVLGRRVAIKTLGTRTGGEDQHFRARFLREARSVSALTHPHIATIYDYGESDTGMPYIVMELIEGPTLADLIRQESLTLPRIVTIIRQVTEALGEAHRQGIIHRDIKPSNVATDKRGEVKVLDFGLAKQLDLSSVSDPERQTLLHTQTREGVIVGTPMYLSPEQALGVDIDARSDLFSLGALLYECIAGKPPFFGKSPVEICARVLRDDPPPPSKFNPQVPRLLDQVTLKALAKKPEARYQTAEEMIQALNEVEASLQNGTHDRTVTRLMASEAGAQPTGALATLSDIFKRPRLSIGYVAAGLVLIALIGLGVRYLMRAIPHKPSAEAQRLYDTGTEAIRNGSFFQASKALELAVRNDDQFALAHARLAEALTELDYVEKAKDEMLRVSELTPNRSSLPAVDALYIDAITATIRRDFSKAVQVYSQIESQMSSEAYAHVDLARAYERNEQKDKAIEQYMEATRRDGLYSTAYLRLGVLYSRSGQQEKAIEAFKKAEELYQAQGKSEGRTEVILQRGALFNKLGKLNEARDQLQQALTISRSAPNLHQQIQALLQLSSVAIEAGDIPQAQQQARDAVDLARSNGLENLAAGGLIDLGAVYLAHGDYGQAEQAIKDAIDFAQRNKGRSNEARGSLTLASLRLQQRNADEARHYAEHALGFYKSGGYRKEISQAFLILGRASRLLGDYDGALRTFNEQLQFAEQTSDQSLIASSYGEIGAVLEQQERYPEALDYYQRRYDIAQHSNDEKGMSNALTNMAGMLWRLGMYDQAADNLKKAKEMADKPNGGFKAVLAAIYQYEAEMQLSLRNFRAAMEKSKQSLLTAGNEYPDVIIRAKRVLGLAQILSGGPSGKSLCDEALELATKIKEPRLISTSQLFLAEALLSNGDASTALSTALSAAETFGRLGQTDSEWRAFQIAARAARQTGSAAKADEYNSKSAESFAALQQKWGDQNYGYYVNRPDVKFLRSQSAQGATM